MTHASTQELSQENCHEFDVSLRYTLGFKYELLGEPGSQAEKEMGVCYTTDRKLLLYKIVPKTLTALSTLQGHRKTGR